MSTNSVQHSVNLGNRYLQQNESNGGRAGELGLDSVRPT